MIATFCPRNRAFMSARPARAVPVSRYTKGRSSGTSDHPAPGVAVTVGSSARAGWLSTRAYDLTFSCMVSKASIRRGLLEIMNSAVRSAVTACGDGVAPSIGFPFSSHGCSPMNQIT